MHYTIKHGIASIAHIQAVGEKPYIATYLGPAQLDPIGDGEFNIEYEKSTPLVIKEAVRKRFDQLFSAPSDSRQAIIDAFPELKIDAPAIGLAFPVAPLVAAIAEFDAGKPARDNAWEQIYSPADLAACEAADKAELQKVQQAFWELTQDRNSRDNCALVSIDFCRKTAAMAVADEADLSVEPSNPQARPKMKP